MLVRDEFVDSDDNRRWMANFSAIIFLKNWQKVELGFWWATRKELVQQRSTGDRDTHTHISTFAHPPPYQRYNMGFITQAFLYTMFQNVQRRWRKTISSVSLSLFHWVALFFYHILSLSFFLLSTPISLSFLTGDFRHNYKEVSGGKQKRRSGWKIDAKRGGKQTKTETVWRSGREEKE